MTKSMPLEAKSFSGLDRPGLDGVGLAEEGAMRHKREQVMADTTIPEQITARAGA